jgi:HK97 family phage major capsid protein
MTQLLKEFLAKSKKNEIRSMPSLLEQRNNLLDEMDGLVNKAKEETRSFTDEESGRFDEIKKEVTKIDKTLAAEEESRAFEKKKETKKAQTPEEIRALEIEKEERAFVDFIRGEQRAANLPVGTNGSLIPLSVATMIVDKVKNLSPLLSKATIWNIKDDLVIPVYDYTQHTTAYQTEFVAVTASAGAFTNVTLKSNIIGSLALIGRSLINRSDVDVVPFIVNEIAKSIANFLESELVNGAGGAGKLNGLAQVAAGQTITGATTLVITPQELIKVQMLVPQVYQADCAWICHPNTLAYIQGLTAGAGNNMLLMGNTLSQDAPFSLLGKPVYVSDNMPQIAAGAKEIFYGDFSGLHIKMVQGVQMQVLNERYADQYAVGVAAFTECDAAIAEPQKIACYKGL